MTCRQLRGRWPRLGLPDWDSGEGPPSAGTSSPGSFGLYGWEIGLSFPRDERLIPSSLRIRCSLLKEEGLPVRLLGSSRGN